MELHHYRADVVFLQETHFLQGTNIKLYSPRFPTWFYSDTPKSRSKGVGFSGSVRFSELGRLADPEGRFLLLKGMVDKKKLTLVNVYCPNKNPTTFKKGLLSKLVEFREGEVVMAGDLNFCMDHEYDSTSRAQGTSKAQLIMIKKQLKEKSLDRCVENTTSEN